MTRTLIPGALVLGLLATTTTRTPAAEEAPAKAPATAVTPAVSAAVQAPTPADPAALKSDASYALGFQNGRKLSEFGLATDDISNEQFVKGFLTALKGQKPEVEEAKLQAAMAGLGQVLEGREKEKAGKNLEAGKKFLEENGKRAGVVTTPSGLQYEILAKGGSEKYVAPKEGAEDNKEFMVNYKGTLIDGTQFDASPVGQPVPMTLQVIPGFKEALTTMPVGAKWKLFIPSNLAYGEQRRSAEIAPNSALVFELELVKIQDAAPAPEGGMPFPMPQGQPGE